SASVFGEAPARERREHVIRESPRARRRDSGVDRRRPGRGDAQTRRRYAPEDPGAARPLRAAAPQLARHESFGRPRAGPARRRPPRRAGARGGARPGGGRAGRRAAGRARGGGPPAAPTPADQSRVVGAVGWADANAVRAALDAASAYQPEWSATPPARRADCL